MNGMCGIRSKFCFALSGLVGLGGPFARGVAPGWFVVAPSARRGPVGQLRRGSCLCLVVAVLFVCVSNSFASNSPLADAAEKSDRAAIRTLLKQRADVNAPQADGMTALHWAAH